MFTGFGLLNMSKVVLFLFCFIYLPLVMGVLCWFLFGMHYVMSYLVLQSS